LTSPNDIIPVLVYKQTENPKKASDTGYNMSVEGLIDRLSEVRMAEIVTFHNLNSKQVRETQLEEMDPL
jgi:hypothetical protein